MSWSLTTIKFSFSSALYIIRKTKNKCAAHVRFQNYGIKPDVFHQGASWVTDLKREGHPHF